MTIGSVLVILLALVTPSSIAEQPPTVVAAVAFGRQPEVSPETVPEPEPPPPGVVICAKAGSNKKAPQSAERMNLRMDHSSME
jgi:hypothetical protein